MAYCLHIAFPDEQTIPGLRGHVRAFANNQAIVVLGPDWTVRLTEYDERRSLNASDFVGLVHSMAGPVLMLRPVQAKTLTEVTQRLEGRQLVTPADAYDAATLLAAVQELKGHHDLGEPLVPLSRAVALMIVRKLEREHLWGGNAKGYMWSDWIPKGRGIDEAFRPHVAGLVFLLKQHNVLISKTSNSQQKYALNPGKREEIGDILRDRKFSIELERVFARDGTTLSTRVLDCLDEYDEH